MSNAGGTGDPTKLLDMDWSNSPQASRQHYTTILNMLPKGDKEKMATEKYVAPRSGSSRQRNWIQLEIIGEIGSGPEYLEKSC